MRRAPLLEDVATPAEQEEAEPDRREGGVTARVVVLSLLLAVFFGYLIPIIDLQLSNSFLGAQHLPPGAVGVLLLLITVNPLLKLAGERLRFSRNEILTVYITCLFSCLIPGHGTENLIISNIIGPYYYATPENGWLQVWCKWLPSWATPALAGGSYSVANRAAVEGWFSGNGGHVPWALWLLPLAAWGVFVLAIYTMLGCLSVMLRAQWGEREALSFPLLRLPLELTAHTEKPHPPGGRFFRSTGMWVGFGIVVFVQMLNGLHFYYPDMPQIFMGIDTSQLFSEPPWNQMDWTPMNLWPIVVAVSYLLTSEISFSLWFFYLFIKFQFVAAYYLGYPPSSLPQAAGAHGLVFTLYERIGATFAYVFFILWIGREHWRHIALRACGLRPAGPEERREAITYPTAFWGFLVAFIFIVTFTVITGVSPIIAFSMWLIYLVIVLSLSRLVTEAGVLFVSQGWTPLGFFAQLVGSGPGTALSLQTGLVQGNLIQCAFINDLRGFIMPSFIQGFKLAHDRGIKAKPLWCLVWAVILIALGMGFWMNVRIGYMHGGLQCDPWYAGNGAKVPAISNAGLNSGAAGASLANILWMLLGGGLAIGMLWARSFIPGFPLHPIGFLMCDSYAAHQVWFSIFLGWLCKLLITRFGGVETYRKAVPIFLGVALGDVVMMIFWLVVDGFTGRVMHNLTPG